MTRPRFDPHQLVRDNGPGCDGECTAGCRWPEGACARATPAEPQACTVPVADQFTLTLRADLDGVSFGSRRVEIVTMGAYEQYGISLRSDERGRVRRGDLIARLRELADRLARGPDSN